nr:hypothetical protein [Tanacetum cinerariifolium]
MVQQLGEGLAIPTDPQHTPTIIQPSLSQPQKTQKPRNSIRKDTQATPNKPSSQGTDSGGGPRCQETMRDTIAQTRFKRVSKQSHDLQFAREDNDHSTYEIASLKRRVKKHEKKIRSRTHRLKRLYKVGLTGRVESSGDKESLGKDTSKQEMRIDDIDADEENTLVSVQYEVVSNDADKKMFDVDVLGGEEVFGAWQNENVVEEVHDVAQVSTAATTITLTNEEITLAQALEELKTSKPKMKGIVFQEPVNLQQQQKKQQFLHNNHRTRVKEPKDKGKGTMIEEHVKPKKKDQIRLDKEAALKLQAKFDDEERLVREKAEKEERANIDLIEEWDDIQAKINDRFLVYLDGLEPYLLEILENGPFVPKSPLSTIDNILIKPQKQWSPEDRRLANQDKRLKSIIISYLPNDVKKSVIKCATSKSMWNDLILSHQGPSDTKDTIIASLRLKFNAFKALEGEKVKETFTILQVLLNELENKGVKVPQAEDNAMFVNSLPKKWLSMNQTQRTNNSIKNDSLATLYGKYNYEKELIDQIYESETQKFTIQSSISKALISNTCIQDSDSDVKEDTKSSSEFLADLNAEFHDKALLANQKRFYKRS